MHNDYYCITKYKYRCSFLTSLVRRGKKDLKISSNVHASMVAAFTFSYNLCIHSEIRFSEINVK